jgi:hypothetical protein
MRKKRGGSIWDPMYQPAGEDGIQLHQCFVSCICKNLLDRKYHSMSTEKERRASYWHRNPQQSKELKLKIDWFYRMVGTVPADRMTNVEDWEKFQALLDQYEFRLVVYNGNLENTLMYRGPQSYGPGTHIPICVYNSHAYHIGNILNFNLNLYNFII